MAAPREPRPDAYPALKLRLYLSPDHWIGPGKARLLALIDETGSIAAAGRAMNMSYKRAWSMVEAVNAMFADPAVSSSRGGPQGGGAGLTEAGKDLLTRYRRLEAAAAAAAAPEAASIAALAVPEVRAVAE